MKYFFTNEMNSKICIISSDNGWGLTKDIQIMSELLEPIGVEIKFNRFNKWLWGKYDLNIHSETVGIKQNFRAAKNNVLIPNQEWFFKQWLRLRKRFNSVFCKTKKAVEIFTHLGFKNVIFTGFTTENIQAKIPFDEKVPEFLHIAGNSLFKNTNALIDCWERNPELPTLHLYNVYEDLSPRVRHISNIDYKFGKVSKKEIEHAQNIYAFHMVPSMAEGFGHVLWEGLCVGAIVFTLNAPPMDEVKSTVKIEAEHWKAHHLGNLYKPVQGALDHEIKNVLAMDASQMSRLSRQSEEEWHHNHTRFSNCFINEVMKWL